MISRVEKFLIRFIVTGLVMVVVVQAIMTKEPYRLYLSWGERLEGQNISYPVNTPANSHSQAPATSIRSPEAS
ncbi:hypothetical protein [Syntrophomonas palmitatica]|uniref:hypothetical protein n=1 Tax=Syntrophomonas palmitatica TaxID=402877 RepID=UPI0006D244D7|nr:hypothetical protein [Syntrophomonas palmitatica]